MLKTIIYSLISIALVVALYFAISYQSGNIVETSPSPSASPESTPTPSMTLGDTVKVVISTERGDITLDLFPKVAPKTVENFVKLAGDGFYEGLKFHRVIDDFMIQGGDPLSKDDDPGVGSGGPGYKFEDEINPKVLGLSDAAIAQLEARGYVYDYDLESLPVNVGTIAMANAGPNTNGSQFFIVTTNDQPHLNGLHTVFGKVTDGMDVVLDIKQGDVISGVVIVPDDEETESNTEEDENSDQGQN